MAVWETEWSGYRKIIQKDAALVQVSNDDS